MISDIFQKLGVVEWMQLLGELHKSGYGRLRWFSSKAPNGCALRCHITTQDNIFANREIVHLDNRHAFYVSARSARSGDDVRPLIPLLISVMAEELLAKGKGDDPDYSEWFEKILTRAINKGEFPIFYGDFFAAPLGHIIVGKEVYRTPPMRMRIISWNIDGLKAHFDALRGLCREYDPDVICLQKIKDSKHTAAFDLPGYRRFQSNAPYAGVATYIKEYLGDETLEEYEGLLKGHILRTKFRYPRLTLFNVYVPYANPQVKGAVAHRQFFDSFLTEEVGREADRIVVCGDMNIVHTGQDCWDGDYQRKQANFHDWERRSFNRLLECGGLVDTYRQMHPFTREYTYFFRNDPEVCKASRGHRIDYQLASESLLPEITRAEILNGITASTNNPIMLEFRY